MFDNEVVECGFYWEMRRHVDWLCVEYADPDLPIDDLRREVRRYVEWLRAMTVPGISEDLKRRIFDKVLADILEPGEPPRKRAGISVGDWLAIHHHIVESEGPFLIGKVVRELHVLANAPGFIVRPHSLPVTRDPDADFAFIAWEYVATRIRHDKHVLTLGLLSDDSEPATRELAARALVDLGRD